MKIPHYYFVDYLTQYEGDRTQSHWNAAKIVNAIKGRPIKGYCTLKLSDGTTKTYYDKDAADLTAVVMGTVGEKLPAILKKPSVLIAIPNHDMTLTSGEDHKIIKSTQEVIAAYNSSPSKRHTLTLWNGLRWRQVRPESKATSGRRSPEVYDGEFRLKPNPPEAPIILFDDVYTSGSQVKAATKFLTERDLEVSAVVTVAKTTHDLNDKPISWRQDECIIDEDFSDWDF